MLAMWWIRMFSFAFSPWSKLGIMGVRISLFSPSIQLNSTPSSMQYWPFRQLAFSGWWIPYTGKVLRELWKFYIKNIKTSEQPYSRRRKYSWRWLQTSCYWLCCCLRTNECINYLYFCSRTETSFPEKSNNGWCSWNFCGRSQSFNQLVIHKLGTLSHCTESVNSQTILLQYLILFITLSDGLRTLAIQLFTSQLCTIYREGEQYKVLLKARLPPTISLTLLWMMDSFFHLSLRLWVRSR